MAPELLDPADDSQATPSTQCDVYSFGSIMLQVRDPGVLFRYNSLLIRWHRGKILTGSVPYHYLVRDQQVVFAIAKGRRPRRPDGTAVTDRRWTFIEWCWSPANAPKSRPCSDEVTEFVGRELAEIMVAGA